MKIAVIDDYEEDRSSISDCIKKYWSGENAVSPLEICKFDSGESFLFSFFAGKFDLIFLDCCMEGLSGLETATEIRKKDRHTVLVFITTSKDYAVDGYLVAASGYLVKPFCYADFERTINSSLSGVARRREYLSLATMQTETKVLLDDIVYCDIDGHYMQVHKCDGTIIRVRMTFSRMCELLAPYKQFLESYRGCQLNMDHVQKGESLDFVMDSGERIPIRKKEQKKLIQQYSEYLFEKTRMGFR